MTDTRGSWIVCAALPVVCQAADKGGLTALMARKAVIYYV